MPGPATLDQLVGQLRRAHAADDAAIDRFRAARPDDEFGSAESAAGAMVREGLVTPYQAQRLLRGEARGLRIANRYRVLDRVGGGGMGQVYLCEDTQAGRAVAVKVLPAALSRNPEAVARFEREARAAAVLEHPTIVRALDVGEDGWHPFLVLEFVDGADLYRYVSARGPLDPRTAAHYVARAAAGLQRAADLGWVHRDVKPHNLMVDRAGWVRILDLGLARPFTPDSANAPVTDQTGGPALLGTADFIAPEQAVDSSRVDGRADIYSLGATFYFLLTGRPPFPDGTVAEKLTWHRTCEPEPVRHFRSDVPERMLRVLAKMMAKDPSARFQAPAEVATALAEWAEAVPPPPDAAALPDWPPAVRRLLGLPVAEVTPEPSGPAPAPVPLPTPPPSPPRPTVADRRLGHWVAAVSIAAGLLTGGVLAARSLSREATANAAPMPPRSAGEASGSAVDPGPTPRGGTASPDGRPHR